MRKCFLEHQFNKDLMEPSSSMTLKRGQEMKKNFPILASVSGIFFTQFYFNNNAIKYQKSKIDSCQHVILMCLPVWDGCF